MIAPELEPFTVDLAGLVPYPGNARRGDLDAITASLEVNGQFRPIVVNRGTLTGRPNEVLAGNHTLEAARALGWPRIAVTWLDVDDTAARAVVLADNGTQRHASYDTDALVALLQAQPDLEGTGWEQPDLAALLAELNPSVPVALVDPDEVPGLPSATVSQPGSLWRLGPHLLLCGDATDPGCYYAPGAEGRQGRGGAGWYGNNAQDTVWEVPRPSASREHPTMKPTELIARALRNSTAPGDLVLDPFAGSGSTMVACHLEGRVARMLELDPRYADVICRRWQQLTGDLPVDAATGADVDFTEEA